MKQLYNSLQVCYYCSFLHNLECNIDDEEDLEFLKEHPRTITLLQFQIDKIVRKHVEVEAQQLKLFDELPINLC
jgi:hypothetical protein